ncbi:MAG: hypothetical protein V1870_03925 [Candidatus Aenigmatarchaeota archaeon]
MQMADFKDLLETASALKRCYEREDYAFALASLDILLDKYETIGDRYTLIENLANTPLIEVYAKTIEDSWERESFSRFLSTFLQTNNRKI